MAYDGAERRIHQVFLTRNTEYHLRRDECVGVRDRRTGQWLADHGALRKRAAGAVAFLDDGSLSARPSLPSVGEALCFDGLHLVTSPVESVERPPKAIVGRYAA